MRDLFDLVSAASNGFIVEADCRRSRFDDDDDDIRHRTPRARRTPRINPNATSPGRIGGAGRPVNQDDLEAISRLRA